jgi:hypothetical protein
MRIYCLICEAHCDDDRLLGVYQDVAEAREAYAAWEDRVYYPFYRIEARWLGDPAREYDPAIVVFETGIVEEV